MSTDFFRPCQDCVNNVRHIHPANDHQIAVHRWYGGKGVGTQISIKSNVINPNADETLLIEGTHSESVSEDDLVTLGQLKSRIGAGA